MRALLFTVAVAGNSVLLKGPGVLANRKDLGGGRRYLALEDVRSKTLLYLDDGVDSSYSWKPSFPLEQRHFYTRRHDGLAAMSLPLSDTTVSIFSRIFRKE